MSAADLIAEAAAAGIALSRVGEDRVKWRCNGTPPPDLLERIKAAKSELLPELARMADERQRARLERLAERFLIRAGHARALPWSPTGAEADVIALHDLVAEWRHLRPPSPAGSPDVCARCGAAAARNAHGAADGGALWLCRPCWAPFDAERDAQARASVLRAMRAVQEVGLLEGVDIDGMAASPPRRSR